jgi:Spy/CpxP family protein refolding chaperone
MIGNKARSAGLVPAVLALIAFGASQAAASPSPQARNRERLRENLLTLRLLRMTRALDLTEEQSARIFPVVNRIEKEKLDLLKRLGPEIDGLRSALEASPLDEADVAARAGRVRELRDAVKAKDDELEGFLEAGLTPLQKAKYLVFAVDFYRGLGQVLDRARRAGAAERRGF